MSEDALTQRIIDVRMLLMDVDGVLTDGSISLVPGSDGLVETKSFHVTDGAGLVLAHRGGLKTGFVSGRDSPVVQERARELRIDEVHLGVRDKVSALDRVVESTGIPPDRIAFMGDDVVDLPVMSRVGFPVAVSNAPQDVARHAAYVTRARGGSGAVREVVELILKRQGKWDEILSEFLK
jgi:3-deoxy-D-manno-octulosonate 8-phosphate phosphatase (KDO 8-P phosphatase)